MIGFTALKRHLSFGYHAASESGNVRKLAAVMAIICNRDHPAFSIQRAALDCEDCGAPMGNALPDPLLHYLMVHPQSQDLQHVIEAFSGAIAFHSTATVPCSAATASCSTATAPHAITTASLDAMLDNIRSDAGPGSAVVK